MLEIVPAQESDFDLIWPIFQSIVKTGDTYVYSPEITKEQAKIVWFDPKFYTFLAKQDGEMVGAYVIRPNHRDLGDHIANAAYIVAPKARRLGIGRAMAYDSFEKAKAAGYAAMQFNYVISTNEIAINLWKSVGFAIVGTVPDAHRHPQLGKTVPIHILYRAL